MALHDGGARCKKIGMVIGFLKIIAILCSRIHSRLTWYFETKTIRDGSGVVLLEIEINPANKLITHTHVLQKSFQTIN